MIKVPDFALLLVVSLVVASCGKSRMSGGPSEAEVMEHDKPLKCLTPFKGPSKGLFVQEPQDLFSVVEWDRKKEIRSERVGLGPDLHAIRIAEAQTSFTGRFMVYRDQEGQSKLLGSVADCKELRYDFPSLRLIPGTHWLESRECVMAGTGSASYWSRYWIIRDQGIHEELALPSSGHQNLDHGAPWREFSLTPDAAGFSEDEMSFSFKCGCELAYASEGVAEASVIVLPEILRTVHFEEGAGGWMVLNEGKSNLTLKEFRILTNPSLEFGPDFWEVYGDDVEEMARGVKRESLRAWLDDNSHESWAVPDQILRALGRLQ